MKCLRINSFLKSVQKITKIEMENKTNKMVFCFSYFSMFDIILIYFECLLRHYSVKQ